MLDTLPVSQTDVLSGGHLRHKGVYQCGFANTRLSGNEHHLAFSLARLTPPMLELFQLSLAGDPDADRCADDGEGVS
jgi:hypothetical protein